MSNKTQLQTNNSALDALITRVNAAKDTAASLPEAGGGGANFETSTVTLNASAVCKYLGTDLQPKEETTSTFETVKNSIAFISKTVVGGSGYLPMGRGTAQGLAVQLTESVANIIIATAGGAE